MRALEHYQRGGDPNSRQRNLGALLLFCIPAFGLASLWGLAIGISLAIFGPWLVFGVGFSVRDDGIALGLVLREFLPWHEVLEVRSSARGVTLMTRHGERNLVITPPELREAIASDLTIRVKRHAASS